MHHASGVRRGEPFEHLRHDLDGDGGGADYRWDGASVAADDGCGVIKPAAKATGRWLVIVPTGGLDVRACGAI